MPNQNTGDRGRGPKLSPRPKYRTPPLTQPKQPTRPVRQRPPSWMVQSPVYSQRDRGKSQDALMRLRGTPASYIETLENINLKRIQQMQRVHPERDYSEYYPAVQAEQQLGYVPSYWENPQRVARYHNAIKAAPPGWQAPDWLDVDSINQAYDWLKFRNQDTPWTEWKYLPSDDPGREFIASMPLPPDDFMFPNEKRIINQYIEMVKKGQASWYTIPEDRRAYLLGRPDFNIMDYDTRVHQEILNDPNFDWSRLPGWQKPAWQFMTGPTGSAVQAAIPGMFIGMGLGGPIGGIVGGLAGGAVGYGAYYGNPAAQKLFLGLNWPAQQVENAIGLGTQVLWSSIKPEEYGDISEILGDWNSLDAAWRAGWITYESSPLLPSVVPNLLQLFSEKGLFAKTSDIPEMLASGELAVPGQVWMFGAQGPVSQVDPVVALRMARNRIKAGDDPMLVYSEMATMFGFTGMARDFLAQSVADPLEIVGRVTNKFVAAGILNASDVPNARAALGLRIPKSLLVSEMPPSARALLQGRSLGEAAIEYSALIKRLPVNEIQAMDGFWGRTGRWIAGLTPEGKVKAGMFSGTGLLDVGNRHTGALGFVQNLLTLTPDARARTGLGMALNNLTVILDRLDPADIPGFMAHIASGDLEQAAKMAGEFVNAPEFYTVLPALRAFSQMDELSAVWQMGQQKITPLINLANALDIDLSRVMDNLVDVKDANRVLAMFRSKLAEAGTPDAAAFIRDIDSGVFNAEALQGLADIFTGDEAIPWHPQQWKGMVYNALADHIADWMKTNFGLKPDSPFFRFFHVLKGAQSLLLLGFNPAYLANNQVNNIFTRAAQGIYGYMSPKAIKAWYERLGVEPYRLRAGVGGMMEEGLTLTKGAHGEQILSNAMKGGDAIATADRVIRNVNNKMGVASIASHKLEVWESQNAWTIAMKKFWGRNWMEGIGFRKMDANLVQMLRDIDPRAPDLIYSAIASGMNKAEIEAAIMGQRIQANARASLREAARVTGMDAQSAVEMLQTLGILDQIERRIENAKTPQDVDAIFSQVRNNVEDQIVSATARNWTRRMMDVANRIEVEGQAAVMDILGQTIEEVTTTWLQQYETMGEAIGELENIPFENMRHKIIEDAYRLNDIRWRRTDAYELQTYQGMMEALGWDSSPDAQAFVKSLDDLHQTHRKAYTYRAKEIRDWWQRWKDKPDDPGRWEDFATVRSRIDVAFEEMFVNENKLMLDQGEVIAKQLATLYGEDVANMFRKGWKEVVGYRSKMVKAVQKHRAKVAKMKARERAAANFKFWQQEYPAMIVDYGEIRKWFGQDVQDAVAGRPPSTPPEDVANQRALLSEDVAQEVAEIDQQIAAQDSNLWKVAAEYDFFGVNEDGTPVPGAKLHLLRLVRKYGGANAKTITIPELSESKNLPLIRKAFENRAAEAKAQMDFRATLETEAATEAATEATVEPARVPVMITKAMEAQLKEKGYTQAEIDKMTPTQAWEALGGMPTAVETPVGRTPSKGDQVAKEAAAPVPPRVVTLAERAGDLFVGSDLEKPKTFNEFITTHEYLRAPLESAIAQMRSMADMAPESIPQSLLQFINDPNHRINTRYMPDVIGERRVGKGVKGVPPGLFADTGFGLDELAVMLEENGYISPSARLDPMDSGAVNLVTRMIQEAIADPKEKPYYPIGTILPEWVKKAGGRDTALRLLDQIAAGLEDAKQKRVQAIKSIVWQYTMDNIQRFPEARKALDIPFNIYETDMVAKLEDMLGQALNASGYNPVDGFTLMKSMKEAFDAMDIDLDAVPPEITELVNATNDAIESQLSAYRLAVNAMKAKADLDGAELGQMNRSVMREKMLNSNIPEVEADFWLRMNDEFLKYLNKHADLSIDEAWQEFFGDVRNYGAPELFQEGFRLAHVATDRMIEVARELYRTTDEHPEWIDNISEYGFTDDFNEAAYILPDGRMIDGSGKRHGGSPGLRAYDHRQIAADGIPDDYPGKYDKTMSDGMYIFASATNAIRVDFSSGDLSLDMYETIPAARQLSKIADMIDAGEIERMYLDYTSSDGTTILSLDVELDPYDTDGYTITKEITRIARTVWNGVERSNGFHRMFDNMLFQQQPQNTLYAVHRIAPRNLRKVAELGGMAAPSLAILRRGDRHGGFGEITLIADRNLVDPHLNPASKIYSADIYSGRVPEATWKRIPYKKAEALLAPLEATEAFVGNDWRIQSVWEALSTRPDRYKAEDSLVDSNAGKYLFLKDRTNMEDFTPVTTEDGMAIYSLTGYKLDTIIRQNGWGHEFSQWCRDYVNVFGEPRLKTPKGYVDYNLTNLVRRMTSRGLRAKEEQMTFSAGKARARIAKLLDSIEAVHRNERLLVSGDEWKAHKAEQERMISDWQTGLLDQTENSFRQEGTGFWHGFDESMMAIASYMERAKSDSRDRMKYTLAAHGFRNVPDELISQGIEIANNLRNMGTEYFEAKVVRPVKLSEFVGAVIPANTPPDVRKILDDAGLTVKVIDPLTEAGSEQALIDSFYDRPHVLFQQADINTLNKSFYDPLDQVIANIPVDRFTIDHLAGSIRKSGIKKAELYFTGLDEILDGKVGLYKAGRTFEARIDADGNWGVFDEFDRQWVSTDEARARAYAENWTNEPEGRGLAMTFTKRLKPGEEPPMLTKELLNGWMEDNRVRLQETVLYGKRYDADSAEVQDLAYDLMQDSLMQEEPDLDIRYGVVENEEGGWDVVEYDYRWQQRDVLNSYDTEADANNRLDELEVEARDYWLEQASEQEWAYRRDIWIERAMEDMSGESAGDWEAVYQEYSEPGGERYREYLFNYAFPQKFRGLGGWEEFVTSHFDREESSNLAFHARVKDRTLIPTDRRGIIAYRKNVLDIDEIQSDWATEISNYGVQTPEGLTAENVANQKLASARSMLTSITREMNEKFSMEIVPYGHMEYGRGLWKMIDKTIPIDSEGNHVLATVKRVDDGYGHMISEIQDYGPAATDEFRAYLQQYTTVERAISDANHEAAMAVKSHGIVPPFPWSDNYYELAFRRMVAIAAAEGKEAISWATSATHVDRWGTERITWHKISGKDDPLLQSARIRDGRYEMDWYAMQEQEPGADLYLVSFEPQIGGRAAGVDLQQAGVEQGLFSDKAHLEIATLETVEETLANMMNASRYSTWNPEYRKLAAKTYNRMTKGDPEGVYMPRKEGLEYLYDVRLTNYAKKWAKKFGATVYDPISYRDYDGGNTIVRYMMDITPEMVEGVSGGVSLFQKAQGGISWQGSRAIFHMFEARNSSTFLHEGVHNWMAMMQHMIDRTGSDRLIQDMSILKDWAREEAVRLNDMPTLRRQVTGMDDLIPVDGDAWTRQHEEIVARGFERYMHDGKAPTQLLADVFAKFKEWLVSIYKYITGSPIDVNLSDEVRAVFDRWMGKDDIDTTIEPVKAEPTPGEINQLKKLVIEIDNKKKQKEVSELTGTDFFQKLKDDAAKIRAEKAATESAQEEPTTGMAGGLLPGMEAEGQLFDVQAKGQRTKMEAPEARTIYDIIPGKTIIDSKGQDVKPGDIVEANGVRYGVKGVNNQSKIVTQDLKVLNPGETVRVADQPAMFQVGSERLLDDPAFQKFFGDSKIVEDDGIPQEVYHGTFNNFQEFRNGSVEGYLGDAYYFTNDAHDASTYASSDGPDPQVKIDRLSDTLYEIDDWWEFRDELAEVTGKKDWEIEEIIDQQTEMPPIDILEALLPTSELKKAFIMKLLGWENEGVVMPVYLRIEEPVRLGRAEDGATKVWMEYRHDPETMRDLLEDHINENPDDFGGRTFDEIPDAEIQEFVESGEYQYLFDDMGYEYDLILTDGAGHEASYEDIRGVLSDYPDVDTDKILVYIKDHYLDYPKTAFHFLHDIAGEILDAIDDDGRLVSRQVVQDIFREMGYDGAILDAYFAFPSMPGVYPGVEHYMAFGKNQIKSVFNRGITGGAGWDTNNPNILFQAPDTRITSNPNFETFFRDSKVTNLDGDPQLVYHGTTSPIDFTTWKGKLEGWTSLDTALGPHFANDPEVASRFAFGIYGGRGAAANINEIYNKGRILPQYLRIENPIDVTDRLYKNGEPVSDQVVIAYVAGAIAFQTDPQLAKEWLYILMRRREMDVDAIDLDEAYLRISDGTWTGTFDEFTEDTFSDQYHHAHETSPDMFRNPWEFAIYNWDGMLSAVFHEKDLGLVYGPRFKSALKKAGYDGIKYTNTSSTETGDWQATLSKSPWSTQPEFVTSSYISSQIPITEGTYRSAFGADVTVYTSPAVKDRTTWIPFDSNQAKSAFNNGDFSESQNFMFQGRDERFPFGGYDQMAGQEPDQARTMDDGWTTSVLPLLDAWQQEARKTAGQRNVTLAGSDPGTQEAMKGYLNNVYNDMSSTKLQAMQYGEMQRDAALLNYSRRYGFDKWLDIVFPYQFWYTRTMLNWAGRVLDKPAWFAMYARLRMMQNKQSRNIPERLRNKLAIPAPYLPEWMGGNLYIDPYRQMFPFAQAEQPMDIMYRDRTYQEQEAERVLQTWAVDGKITEAQAAEALRDKESDLWKEALAQAKITYKSEIANPFDFISTLMGPAWYLTTPFYALTGQTDKIGELPVTRTARAVEAVTNGTWAEPVGDVIGMLAKPEEWIREKTGLPQMGEYGDYYINRQLANMVADGVIDSNTATQAMIERSGEAYDQAVERVKMELAVRVPGATTTYAITHGAPLEQIIASLPTSVFGAGLLPEGELRYRGLYQKWNAAWKSADMGDTTAVSKFFDDHPEYSAYLARKRTPEENLQNFLVGEVWDRYMALDKTERRLVRGQLGTLFNSAFLNKETRDYSAIPTETLAIWARMLGGTVPETEATATVTSMPEGEFPQLEGLPPNVAASLQNYNVIRDQMFPNIDAIQSMYFAMPESTPYLPGVPQDATQVIMDYRDARSAKFPNWYADQKAYFDLPEGSKERTTYLKQHPALAAYWDWAREQKAQHPEIEQYAGVMRAYAGPREQFASGQTLQAYWDWRKQYIQEHPEIRPFVDRDFAQAIMDGQAQPFGADAATIRSLLSTYYTSDYEAPLYTAADYLAGASTTLMEQLYAYKITGTDLGTGGSKELRMIWESAGMPGGDFQKFLDQVILPGL